VWICQKCGGEAKVIPNAFATLSGQALADTSDRCIEDQAVIDKILAYLIKKDALPPPPELLPAARASPGSDWFAWSRDFTSAIATRPGNQGTGCLVARCLMEAWGLLKIAEEGRFRGNYRMLNR
jgi:hypothetical protein